MRPVTFAIPGPLTRRLGAIIYDGEVLQGLRDHGHPTAYLQLAEGFPTPSAAEIAEAEAALLAVPASHVLVIDGWIGGVIDTEVMCRIKAPIVAMTHHPLALETGLTPARATQLRQRETANMALAACVVAPSQHTADLLVQDFGVAPARLLVGLPGFARPTLTPMIKTNPALIVSVGVLVERKGHDVLLNALAGIADLPWQAEIIGQAQDADLAAALSTQAAMLGLAGRVTFLGSLSAQALQARYRAATVFALATRFEGYGMVFSEAMQFGLPVVSTRAGAVPQTVPEGSGLLADVDDVAGFATHLRRVLSDSDLRATLSAGAFLRAKTLPTWADTTATMRRAIDQAGAQI
jgi:glycosyltransferase involved in cell wall biosynthesis